MVRLKLQRKPAMLRTASFALSLLCAAGAHAQVYKCVDPGGRITYSQIPCPAHTRSGAISRHIDRPASAPAPAEPPEKGGPYAVGPVPADRAGFFRYLVRTADPVLLLRRAEGGLAWELRRREGRPAVPPGGAAAVPAARPARGGP